MAKSGAFVGLTAAAMLLLGVAVAQDRPPRTSTPPPPSEQHIHSLEAAAHANADVVWSPTRNPLL